MIIPRPLPRVIPRPAPAWVAAISGPSLDPDPLDPDALVFNGVVIWFNGAPILFTNA